MQLIHDKGSARSVIARCGKDGEYVSRIASTDEDRLKCWHLVYAQYLASGYTKPQALELRYNLHDALPDAATFMVEKDGQVVATVSVYPDSPLGLPADNVFGDELNRLRNRETKLVEIGRLTVDSKMVTDRKVMFQMMELPLIHARRVLGATDVAITVNPCHESYYSRMLLFDKIGAQKEYDGVCGAPAVLLHINLAFQELVVRAAHGDGTMPNGEDVRRTIYRSFASRLVEDELVDRICISKNQMPADFFHTYFVRAQFWVSELQTCQREFMARLYPGCDLCGNPTEEVQVA